jgi:hypothetical protein
VRQIKRLKQRLLAEGPAGLVSKKRGRPSNRQLAPELLEQALGLVARHYADFGPTLACEKLQERHGLNLSVETLRKAMIAHGLWRPRRGAGARLHQMRERRPRRGELVQVDGSLHDWFEGRAPRCCLLVFIDDATGELMALRFVHAETTLGYMGLLASYIVEHGLPAALYSDRHSVFRVNTSDEKKSLEPERTQFARALEQLGIEGIQANSPQAKGRVERANQTLQDRLVKEMRLHGIDSPEAANAWLPQFIRAFNRRFAVPAAVPIDAHVPFCGQAQALRRILAVHTPRKLSANLSCQHHGELFQLAGRQERSLRHARVSVVNHTDGAIEILYNNESLRYVRGLVPAKQPAPVDGKQLNAKVEQALAARHTAPPPVGHPWKKPIARSADGTVAMARFQQPTQNLPL